MELSLNPILERRNQNQQNIAKSFVEDLNKIDINSREAFAGRSADVVDEFRKSFGGKFDFDLLEKGGEGSRGGKVIGHTKSGKPIYDDKNNTAFEQRKQKLKDKNVPYIPVGAKTATEQGIKHGAGSEVSFKGYSGETKNGKIHNVYRDGTDNLSYHVKGKDGNDHYMSEKDFKVEKHSDKAHKFNDEDDVRENSLSYMKNEFGDKNLVNNEKDADNILKTKKEDLHKIPVHKLLATLHSNYAGGGRYLTTHNQDIPTAKGEKLTRHLKTAIHSHPDAGEGIKSKTDSFKMSAGKMLRSVKSTEDNQHLQKSFDDDFNEQDDTFNKSLNTELTDEQIKKLKLTDDLVNNLQKSNIDDLQKGEIMDKLVYGYGAGNNDTFKFAKTGKQIKEMLPGCIEALAEQKGEIIATMQACIENAGIEPTEDYSPSQYKVIKIKRYPYELIKQEWNEVNRTYSQPTDAQKACCQYNDLCWSLKSILEDILACKIILANVEDDKKYNLTISQLVALTLGDDLIND